MVAYIYKTTNLINNKIYIGQKRSTKFLNWYKGSGKHLKKALNCYGKDNFSTIILEEINLDNQNFIDSREIYWIRHFEATNPNIGYNIAEGGLVNRTFVGENNPMYGKTHSQETKRIIGEKQSIAQRKRGYNISQTVEVKQKISKALKGHEVSLETRNKIREKLIGKSYLSEEAKKRISEKSRQRKHTKEELEKMSLANSGVNNGMYGKMWVHNDIKNMCIPKEAEIPKGFVKGFVKGLKGGSK